MNEESFNKPWLNPKDSIEYGPDETVESFGRKMQIEQQKELEKQYKPTEKEKEIIKLLSIPIKNKIKELDSVIEGMPVGEERKSYENGINNLLAKLKQIEMPENMSKDDIKDLLFRANARMDSMKEYSSLRSLYKIRFLEKEIDFLLEQLQKRIK
jgi:hypothetical protein